MQLHDDERKGPLDGVIVLDITHVMAGAYCSLLLADMGADVIKVEPVTTVGPRGGLASGSFEPVNRNKRSLAVDLKSEEGLEAVRKLAETADIVVQNYRPGSLDRLGLGYQDLVARNSNIIYCSISGFGLTGPYRDRGGFDLVAQGMSGVMSINGTMDGPPTKLGVPLADLNAGMYGAMAILSALYHREKTGIGQHIDASLLESALAYTVWDSSTYLNTGEVPMRTGSTHRLTAPYDVYPTADGWLALGGANQSVWERLICAIDRGELAADPRFVDPSARVANERELFEILSEVFKDFDTQELWEMLDTAGVPCGPINNLAEAWADPQVVHREMVVTASSPVGPQRFIGPPVKLSGTPWKVRRGVPSLGADSLDVLSELAGYAQDEVRDMLERGIVRAQED